MKRTRISLVTGVLGLLALVVFGTYWGTMTLSAYSRAELDAATEKAHQSGLSEGYAQGLPEVQRAYDNGYAEGYAAAQTKDLNDIKAYLPLLLLAAYNRGASSAPAPAPRYIAPSSVSCSSYAIGDWLRTNCYGW